MTEISDGFDPDFVSEEFDDWTWLVYPWNFLEKMVKLTRDALASASLETATLADLQRLLADRHNVDRVAFDVAQSGRLGEVLSEMVRRDGTVSVEIG